eukprot:6191855-Pleurochrysis_carterae.AAC.1
MLHLACNYICEHKLRNSAHLRHKCTHICAAYTRSSVRYVNTRRTALLVDACMTLAAHAHKYLFAVSCAPCAQGSERCEISERLRRLSLPFVLKTDDRPETP